MTPVAQVIVVDDQEDIGYLLERLLRACKDLCFAIWLPTPEGLGARIASEREQGHPVVVVLDYNIPGFDTLNVLRDVSAEFPDVRVLIFSGDDCHAEVMAAGAFAFMSKDGALGAILEAIRKCSG